MPNIEIYFLEVLVMPNDEVICLGKTLGWKQDFKNYLIKKADVGDVVEKHYDD
jgi:hypothetical protein